MGTEDRLEFEWDAANIAHLAAHRVTPREAEQVMLNNPADIGYEMVDREPRWKTIGHTNRARVLVLVWTVRHERIRIVTGWPAEKRARDAYFRARGIL